jgi:type II secretory pathway pseudopilin PulG
LKRNGNRALTPISQQGFTYMAMLAAVAVSGLMLTAVGEIYSRTAQREKEQELLFVGQQFRNAIQNYYERSPGAPRFPDSLEELLKDKRFPNAVRHLRRVYTDPMTGKAEWGFVTSPEGQIMGVHSLSTAEPLKKGNFSEQNEALKDKRKYTEWKFVYVPPPPPPPDQPQG